MKRKFKLFKFHPKATFIKFIILTILICLYVIVLKWVTTWYGIDLKATPATIFSGVVVALLVNHVYDYITIYSQHAQTRKRVIQVEKRALALEKRLSQVEDKINHER